MMCYKLLEKHRCQRKIQKIFKENHFYRFLSQGISILVSCVTFLGHSQVICVTYSTRE